jgi:hypothetical protein
MNLTTLKTARQTIAAILGLRPLIVGITVRPDFESYLRQNIPVASPSSNDTVTGSGSSEPSAPPTFRGVPIYTAPKQQEDWLAFREREELAAHLARARA